MRRGLALYGSTRRNLTPPRWRSVGWRCCRRLPAAPPGPHAPASRRLHRSRPARRPGTPPHRHLRWEAPPARRQDRQPLPRLQQAACLAHQTAPLVWLQHAAAGAPQVWLEQTAAQLACLQRQAAAELACPQRQAAVEPACPQRQAGQVPRPMGLAQSRRQRAAVPPPPHGCRHFSGWLPQPASACWGASAVGWQLASQLGDCPSPQAGSCTAGSRCPRTAAPTAAQAPGWCAGHEAPGSG